MLPAALIHQAPDGTVEWADAAFESLTGFSPEQWNEETGYWLCVHECDEERVRRHWRESLESDGVFPLDYRLRLPSSRPTLWISERRRRVRSPGGALSFQVTWQDRTAEHMAGERLPWSTWQRSLASLTPGVTHDLNNHFASILALSDNFVRRLTPDHPHHEGMVTIRDSVQQAARLLQRLVSLHYARGAERAYHDLNEVTRDFADLLRHAVFRRIGFEFSLHPGRLPVYADANELRRTLLTLVKNAVESIPNPGSGSIRFETGLHTALPDSLARDVVAREVRSWVSFTLSDSGAGVANEDRARLFEPWFSTKPPSEGNGLGLSLVKAFARNHGGCVQYAPRAGGGSAFSVWLPLSDLTESDRQNAARRPSILLHGEESALPEAANAMRAAGFKVVASASHALEIVRQSEEPFDALCILASSPPDQALQLVRALRGRRWRTRIVAEVPSQWTATPGAPRPDLQLPGPLSGASQLSRLQSALMPAEGASPGSR